MFVPEKHLKDLVVRYVKEKEQSISSLTRTLEKDGYRFHRLFITGYLKALSDVGVLREREIPPAKVYAIRSARDRNLYEALGERVRELHANEAKAARLAVAVLYRLFHRPVFARELKECGFNDGGEAPPAPKEEREEARRLFAGLGVKIPTNEPAWVAPDKRNAQRDALISDLLIERFGQTDLVLETRQTRLE